MARYAPTPCAARHKKMSPPYCHNWDAIIKCAIKSCLTVLSIQVLSLKAPQHPRKLMTTISPPATISTIAEWLQ